MRVPALLSMLRQLMPFIYMTGHSSVCLSVFLPQLLIVCLYATLSCCCFCSMSFANVTPSVVTVYKVCVCVYVCVQNSAHSCIQTTRSVINNSRHKQLPVSTTAAATQGFSLFLTSACLHVSLSLLSVCMYVSVFLCLSSYMCLCVCVSMSVCLFVSVCLCVCVCVCVCVFVSLCVCVLVCMCLYVSVRSSRQQLITTRLMCLMTSQLT